MTVVKQILGRHVTFGGELHSGWLPNGATTPMPTPTRDVTLNIDIRFDGSGYLLCWVSADGDVAGDLWYQTLADAEQAAVDNFGIRHEEWQTIV